MDSVNRKEMASQFLEALNETNQSRAGAAPRRLTGPEAMAYEKIGNKVRTLVSALNPEKISAPKKRLLGRIVRKVRNETNDITDDRNKGVATSKIDNAAGELYVALNNKENIDRDGNLIEAKLVSKILEVGKEFLGIEAPKLPKPPEGPDAIDLLFEGL